MGFPVVSADYEPTTRTLTLEQHRFFTDGSDGGDQLWRVPITLCTADRPDAVERVLLTERKQSFVLEHAAGAWLKVRARVRLVCT